MERVEVPGGWVNLRDPDTVTERQRRPFVRLMMAHGQDWANVETDEDGNPKVDPSALPVMQEMQEAAILALVAEWSFDAPVTPDGLLDIPPKAYDRLVWKEAQARMGSLMPDFGVNPEESSPTGASGG